MAVDVVSLIMSGAALLTALGSCITGLRIKRLQTICCNLSFQNRDTTNNDSSSSSSSNHSQSLPETHIELGENVVVVHEDVRMSHENVGTRQTPRYSGAFSIIINHNNNGNRPSSCSDCDEYTRGSNNNVHQATHRKSFSASPLSS